jgi:citronellol/citronellal dehydrogenase
MINLNYEVEISYLKFEIFLSFKRRSILKLEGKVAIVTGSSRGLGKAIALSFAREGATVVIAARSQAEQKGLPGTIFKTVDEIKAQGGTALAVACDVTEEASVNSMVDKTLEEFGRVDVLVNNAGIAFYHLVLETPARRWEIVMKVNLLGPFQCSKAVLYDMIKRRSGSIINISSLAADERDEGTVPTGAAYAASKAALDRFTFSLAAEAGKHNIAVNALKPHKVVDTDGMRLWQPDADRSLWQSTDMMVRSAVFLASQDGSGVTATIATDREICTWHGL